MEDQSLCLAISYVDIQLLPLLLMYIAKREALEFTPFAKEVGFRHIDHAHPTKMKRKLARSFEARLQMAL